MTKQAEVFRVGMGELHHGKPPQRLRALVGSCLGIVLYADEHARYSLSHAVLPHSAGVVSTDYVDASIALMIRHFARYDLQPSELKAHLYGGGDMREAGIKKTGAVGKDNIKAAERLLEEAGIPIVQKDVGGNMARMIYIDCANGKIEVRRVE